MMPMRNSIWSRWFGGVTLPVLLALPGCVREPAESPVACKQVGKASWYGPGFHGRETASGEIFNQNELTAAHRLLPLGTRVEVTHLKSGKSVKVEITDRGPYVVGRVIDLSRAAAKRLGIREKGVAPVKIEAKPQRETTAEGTVVTCPKPLRTQKG